MCTFPAPWGAALGWGYPWRGVVPGEAALGWGYPWGGVTPGEAALGRDRPRLLDLVRQAALGGGPGAGPTKVIILYLISQ